MQQKTGASKLVIELELAFTGQDEIWEFPETPVRGDSEEDSESPSMEELIQLVLRGNESDRATTTQMESER